MAGDYDIEQYRECFHHHRKSHWTMSVYIFQALLVYIYGSYRDKICRCYKIIVQGRN